MKKGQKFWNKVRLFFVYIWRPALLVAFGAGIIYYLLWFRLGSLTGGLSPTEAVAQGHLAAGDISFKTILDNPLYLPHSLVLFALQKLELTGATALRGVSALIGTATIAAFYFIIHRWHTNRMAIFGTALFACSSWFLHVARFGGTDILYTSLILIILAGIWLQQSRKRKLMLSIVLFTSALYLYVPGLIWFILPTVIWQAKRILREMRRVPIWFNIIWSVSALLLLAPLFWSIANDPGLIRPLLGLPEHFAGITEILKNFLRIPVYIFAKGPDNPERWLAGTAYLDIFSGMMLIVGIYWSMRKFQLDRIRVQTGAILLGSILIALGGPVHIALLIPFVYLLITAGMTFMLQQWFTVFPRNPIARTVGTILMSIAVLITIFYHINHYFIAWPNAPATRASYDKKPLSQK